MLFGMNSPNLQEKSLYLLLFLVIYFDLSVTKWINLTFFRMKYAQNLLSPDFWKLICLFKEIKSGFLQRLLIWLMFLSNIIESAWMWILFVACKTLLHSYSVNMSVDDLWTILNIKKVCIKFISWFFLYFSNKKNHFDYWKVRSQKKNYINKFVYNLLLLKRY